MEKKFKVGDWCFYEFELHQIKEMDGAMVISVSNGNSTRFSNVDLTKDCFPLTIPIKLVSEEAMDRLNTISQAGGNRVNYPDLHTKVVSIWSEICNNIDNNEIAGRHKSELSQFTKVVIEEINKTKNTTVFGVEIYK
jgi:hypothetical protein